MREKFRSSLGLLCFIYVLLFIGIVYKLLQIGLLGKNSLITQGFEKINFESYIGIGSTLFFIIFYSIIFYIVKSNIDEIITYEDDNISNKIYRKLIVYKVLVVLSVTLGICITVASNDIDILFTSIFLIINSILTHYTKKGYLKSYMYNKQLQSYEDVYKPKKKLGSIYYSLFMCIAIMITIVKKIYIQDINEYKDATYIQNENHEEYINNPDNEYEDTIYTESENYEEYINDPEIVLSGQEILDLYQSTQKDTLGYKIMDPNEYYVESTFNTFEHYEGMIDKQIVDEKKYGQILYPYTYDSYEDNISLQKEVVMYLISLVLPSDAIEERVLTNKGYGQECRVYSSSEGTFVVRMQKAQYFKGTQPYYHENEIVDLKYLKLIE
ncbi:hypothetical protein [Romboutsia sp.]|uniref:hypothetical protein n=1 Tax=Romboutsia sp. TaxID=1965302 RepID=UPI002B939A82|nr:hypothetical protein [Romboutsia sp.]HSQ87717.1 hypothetical protein [Romboutsia sp.]